MDKCNEKKGTSGMRYYGCYYIEHFHLNFNGMNGHQSNNKAGCIEFCCLSLAPGIGFFDSIDNTIKSLIKKRSEIIMENKAFGNDNIIDKNTSKCAKCPYFKEMKGTGDGFVHFININMYPAPCQSKCIYCGVHNSELGIFDKEQYAEIYEKMFQVIKMCLEKGMIAEDAVWQVASGEITIHPYKDRIFEIIKNKNVKILTNVFIFDEKIADILNTNICSSINLSIDSGTPETWHKVKGVNNFSTVIDNLSKYSASCLRPEQITLKYIMLPGINDNVVDFQGVIQIMKRLKINKISISRDNRFRIEKLIIYNSSRFKDKPRKEQYSPTDKAIECFSKELKKNNMIAERAVSWPDDYEEEERRLLESEK